MADDCKKTKMEMVISSKSVRKVVRAPVCHVVERGSIPRQRELLELKTSFHKTTDSAFGLQIFRKKQGRRLSEKAIGKEHQINISVSEEVSFPFRHTGDWGPITRKRELLEVNTRFHQITDLSFDLN